MTQYVANTVKQFIAGPPGPSGAKSGTATAGGPIAARDLVYLAADGTCRKADATAEGKEAIGFVRTDYASGESVTYHMIGSILSGLSDLVPGTAYYLSTTPGQIVDQDGASQYADGNVLMKIGTALSATELLFYPELPITL